MAGSSSYEPKSALGRWFDQRLPVARLMHDNFISFPVPKNLNAWYVFGGILAFMLALQFLTGIVLAMHYVPNAGLAFASVEQHIMREVNYGWLIRSLHATGASMLFVAIYIHMARGLYYGSYKAPRELIWILGVVLYILMMGTAFFGYTLPWGQTSFWGATVITGLPSALDQVFPHFGTWLTTWLRGDYAVGNATLNRFFSLHYCIPFVIAGFIGLHVWALHRQGNNNPLGVEPKGAEDSVAFHPRYTAKDAFYLVLFLIIFLGFVFYAPDFFAYPSNFVPADPLSTPSDIMPEWYMLPYYAMLRAVPNTLIGVLVLAAALLTLFFVPWLDTSKVRSCRFRPVMQQLYWVLLADCILLGFVGYQSADATVHAGVIDLPLVWLARLGTLYYFAFFWVLMPWIGKNEVTLPVPESIATAAKGDA